MKDEVKLPSGWIRRKSKSHPDRDYYYNPKLKLSVWKIEDINKDYSQLESRRPSNISPDKKSNGISQQSIVIGKKNGAKERMKNLQKNFKLEIEQSNEFHKPRESIKFQVNKDNKKNVAKDRMETIKKYLQKEVEQKATTSTANDDVELMDVSFEEEEPMEWEPIDEEKVFEEIEKIRSSSDNVIKTQSSNFDNLNESRQKTSTEFYIVIDTNILISNLDFVKEIKGKYFKEHGKATIYLPYMVLDELDVLKNRDSVAVHARRANSFIDNCLTSKDQFLTGESRLENEKLIPINSPDDEILNCCLKIKKLTQKVILLSNDKNLRNKANLNHVTGLSYEMLKESRDKLIQLD